MHGLNRYKYLVLLILLIGVILAAIGFKVTQNLSEQAIRIEQERTTDLIREALFENLLLKVEDLLGLRALMQVLPDIDTTTFEKFSNVYLSEHEDILILAWIARISHTERAVFEQSASRLHQRAIVTLDSKGQKRSRQERYFPVLFATPKSAEKMMLGLDMSGHLLSSANRSKSDSTRAIESSPDMGIPGTIAIMDKNLLQLFLPVGNTEDFTEDLSEQLTTSERKSPSVATGYAFGEFDLSYIMRLAINYFKPEAQGLTLALMDVSDPLQPKSIYGQKLVGHEKWIATHTFGFGGGQWALSSLASPDYISSRTGTLPAWTAASILLLTLLISVYIFSLKLQELKTEELVKQRTEELVASENRFRIILQEAADAIITINQQGLIESVNPAAERMFGYTHGALLGKNIKVLMPEPFHSEHDGYLKHFKQTGERKIIGRGREVTGLRRNGNTFPLHLSVGEGRLNNHSIFVGILSDLSERKRYEEILIQARESAEEANRQKSSFLNVMSHELRTPLTVILGYLPLLQNSDTMPTPKMIAEIVKDMDISGQHLLELINDLLDISKIEAGQLDLHPELNSSHQLVDKILQKFSNQAEQKGLSLNNEVDDFELFVDPKRLRQILINLIGNAIKFTEQGKVTLRARLQDSLAVFEVSDSGMGIPEDQIEIIFEPFRQVDSSSTRKIGGTGLGLTITRRLIELHGGELSVSSKLGQGSTFRFTLQQESPQHGENPTG